jgi:hypothetical protein
MIDEKDADYFVFKSRLGLYVITPEQKTKDFSRGGDEVSLCPVISINKANELLKAQSSPDEKDIA